MTKQFQISPRTLALQKAAQILADNGRADSALTLLSFYSKDELTNDSLKILNRIRRKPGVSVVIPTYKGVKRIFRALESLRQQTLNRNLFEIIIVQNGPRDGTEGLVDAFQRQNPNINIVLLYSEPAGAGIARNTGCAAAGFDHMTFLDDDDYFSSNFLEELYAFADGGSIVFSQITDFDDSGFKESLVNTQLVDAFKNSNRLKPADAPGAATALTMTCIKLFPSYIPEVVSYDKDLRNGEDVVFWTEALARFNPDLLLCPIEKMAIYYREVRQESISRQPVSFQFNIIDRIELAKRIEKIYSKYPTDFVKSKYLSAAYFMVSYLREKPQDYPLVIDACRANGLDSSIFQYINKSTSKTLAVSFCFPPWVDTAGVVAAKRMREFAQPFDAISNQMSPWRSVDDGLKGITHDLIGDHVELDIPTKSTVDTASIVNFARRTLAYTINLNKYRKYEKLYSRAMWPASHFAAGAIKAAIPAMRWTAEFSDPMVTDILSQKWPGTMDMEWLFETAIIDNLREKGFPLLDSDSLMEWCEYITYALADEIIFTNENQRDYMLSQPWITALRGRIDKKTVISPHPTLPIEYYRLVKDDWQPLMDRISIAYFGSFYKTRGLDELLEVLSQLDMTARSRIQLDIYTTQNPDLEERIRALGIVHNVTVRSPLPYFQFLARCRSYDLLLVNDAATKGIKPFNPYLPSKLSDYLGSGVAIWALVEEGSPMSKVRLPEGSIVSELGDANSYSKALKEISTALLSRRRIAEALIAAG